MTSDEIRRLIQDAEGRDTGPKFNTFTLNDKKVLEFRLRTLGNRL